MYVDGYAGGNPLFCSMVGNVHTGSIGWRHSDRGSRDSIRRMGAFQ